MHIYSRCKVQQPSALEHDGVTKSEAAIEKHTTLRVRSTGSAFCRNYDSTKREDHAEADKNL